jgi:hypothetical protein
MNDTTCFERYQRLLLKTLIALQSRVNPALKLLKKNTLN